MAISYADIRYRTITNEYKQSVGLVTTAVYTTVDDLPSENIDVGTRAFISSSNTLYMYKDSAWFKVQS